MQEYLTSQRVALRAGAPPETLIQLRCGASHKPTTGPSSLPTDEALFISSIDFM
jgi:hypothetical protein